MQSNRNSFVVGWNANGTASFRDSLGVSYKTRYNFIILFSNCAPRYLPNWSETLCLHSNLHMNVYIAALFLIADNRRQASCPSIGEWINCGTFLQWNVIQQ